LAEQQESGFHYRRGSSRAGPQSVASNALASGISGSGPTVFALARTGERKTNASMAGKKRISIHMKLLKPYVKLGYKGADELLLLIS